MDIQFKRGVAADITSATATIGSPKFTTDTKRLYVGDGTNNVEFPNKTDLDDAIATAVTAVTYDSTNKKITETIDGTASDVITDTQLKAWLELNPGAKGKILKSIQATTSGPITYEWADFQYLG